MNISLLSIRGRISLAVISILILVLIPIVYVSYQVTTIYTTNQYLEGNVRQIEYLGSSLKNTLNQSFAYLSLYGLYHLDSNYQNSAYENETIHLFERSQKTEQELIEIEQNTPAQYTYYETKVKIRDISEDFESLTEKYDLLTNAQNLKAFIHNQILPLHLKLDKLLAELIQEEQRRAESMQSKLNENITKIVIYTFLLFIFTLLIAITIIYILLSPVFEDLTAFKKYISVFSRGGLPEVIEVKNIEIKELVQNIELIIFELKKVKILDKSMTISPFNKKGDLGIAFSHVQKAIQEVLKIEKIRNWQNQGISSLGETIRKHAHDIEDLCANFLDGLVEHTSSAQAAIFIHNSETNLLELQAAFAYGKRKYLKKEKEIGEDLLTEVFKDGETLFLTDIPKDYLEIRSGLGKKQAKCIIIVPLKYQNSTIGVLEIASFDIFKPYQIEVVERVGEIFSASIATAMNSKQAKELLNKARMNAKKIAAKEEILSKQAKGFLVKQQVLEENNKELSKLIQEQKVFLEENVLGIIITNKIGQIQEINVSASTLFAYNRNHLRGANITKLIPDLNDLNKQYKEDQKKRYFVDYQGVRKDNEIFFVQAIVSQLGQGKEEFYSILLTRSQPSLLLKKKEEF